jgi:folate-binding protein YgfZ
MSFPRRRESYYKKTRNKSEWIPVFTGMPIYDLILRLSVFAKDYKCLENQGVSRIMKNLFLHEMHEKAGANFIDVRDQRVPADYGDIRTELDAINKNVALLDRSYLGKVAVTGQDALDLLNRVSTNDLQYLAAGTMCDTVFVSPKGRLIDYCRVINTGDELILIGSFFHVNHLIDWINRFIILEDVQVTDVSGDYIWMTLIGPHSKLYLGQLTSKTITGSEESIWIEIQGKNFPVLKNVSFKYPAYNFFFNNTDAWSIISALQDKLVSINGQLIGDTAFQIVRVESGMPDWGTEITQDYNPHEARLTHAISFTKGCYTGQEVIARLDTYEKVQKYLMIVELSERLSQMPPLEVYIDEEQIGHLTSYTYNPVTEKSLGLAYIKKMFTTENDIYVEIKMENSKIPAKLRIPPQAYI